MRGCAPGGSSLVGWSHSCVFLICVFYIRNAFPRWRWLPDRGCWPAWCLTLCPSFAHCVATRWANLLPAISPIRLPGFGPIPLPGFGPIRLPCLSHFTCQCLRKNWPTGWHTLDSGALVSLLLSSGNSSPNFWQRHPNRLKQRVCTLTSKAWHSQFHMT